MSPFRKILVAVDDRPARGAIATAARLAKRAGAAVRLVTVVPELPWYTRLVLPTADELQSVLVRERTESLRRLGDALAKEGLTVSSAVLRGRPHLEIVREVLRGGHDLLIKEAEPNDHVAFGSTDMHLLRTCPCPFWLLKPGHGEGPFARVLVPVDPSPPPDEADVLGLKGDLDPKDPELDAKLLALAGDLAEADGAELHVLHTWSAPGEDLIRGEALLAQDQVERYVEDSRAEAKKALDHLIARSAGAAGRRSVHLLKGDPAEMIVEFAKARGIDLIVMGTVARTGIGGLVIGNTAESILQRVGCSVLAIKPDGFVSPVSLDES